ncbi:MAG: hypothetical protein CO186_12225 [Zetaproteobacteria bacterium CG_4_9_14_3_um_filter_49_83]|nr:MAG: hypothetical protein AUJ56_05540 [Zetaproteobacteria bacterium CG1_02_49_23]PIQ31923.1 MAG: hypothetical protein COW62_08565 [Zetaproteobacteria bacterium CG17_big_fil_post_rev_8_21_14_2_50_50_13]PIV29715.1 MAG: hypothetical protein COS35_10555 [Zetaproteobacteria bacterium CG02_land_8_20_14_3_00_50_9]PIY56181.1 MAG: hypothetical protein COZ00_05530 [Zetaproteobacteria bacterium CG_4_10_14_0_8_um_filter_49_80]PJA33987.1 MAG: hypothetical protein CO186_12225 [Zetaproteobacteria bacterium
MAEKQRFRSKMNVHETSAEARSGSDLEQRHDQLESALMGTVFAISKVFGARDPYLQDHQHHVAHFSSAIAKELGWSRERIKGLHCGAMIYDIGKVSIPAEILNKPRKLTSVEFQLMKAHTTTGYDILKDINFPWPIADIAHQHHERLDGSGYPQGLKGDQICPEAKIVAVADAVGAMLSHRPYRAALARNTVLAEVEAKKGVLFDVDVVDACTCLIRDKGYII